jgi:hypothetical protein
VQPYGFGALDGDGSVYTIMNPSESVATITLPVLSQAQQSRGQGRVQFRDAGFVPQLTGDHVVLGPEQMAVVGFGKYASPQYDFGVQDDVVIPRSIHPMKAGFREISKGVIEATVQAPQTGDLRLIMQQYSPDGSLRRTWAGGPPAGTNMAKVFMLKAEQDGRELPIHENYDRVIWAGLSWAEGEISHRDLRPGAPVTLTFSTTEKDPVTIKGCVYAVTY